MGSRLLTVNDVLAGHVTLDVECLDRIYLNGYVPNPCRSVARSCSSWPSGVSRSRPRR